MAMKRWLNRTTQNAVDIVVLTGALFGAFAVRFDWEIPRRFLVLAMVIWPWVVVLQFAVLVLFGVHRFAWSYVGLREAGRIFAAVLTSTLLLAVVRALTDVVPAGGAHPTFIPLGVLVVNAVFAFLGIAGVRFARRIAAETLERGRQEAAKPPEFVPTLIIGAGRAGTMVVREISSRPDLGIDIVGILDDDITKVGTVVQGHTVLGTTAVLGKFAEETGAKQAIIAISKLPGTKVRELKRKIEAAGLDARIIPGLFEIVQGQVALSRIRSVAIEDLLRRDPVILRDDEVAVAAIRDRTVLVTGAGGSIGSELCRQLVQLRPRRLVLVEQAETSLFYIHRELMERNPPFEIVPCIADICDRVRMDDLFARHRPAVVFHAAAHKHVPMMEWNPVEAVKNNVLGTRTTADLAHRYGVDRFVMISTDKAINPTSVMGCSKRIAEIYCQALAQRSETKFVTVRFGNVLGSAGSVIPIFKAQIEKGGPVTVTDPEMRRYFMTIPEACALVVQAGTIGEGGEILVLDMGEPVKIVDLARDLIQLSGLTPGEDIEIRFTGMRPGEKLFEELSTDGENLTKTRHPKIFVGRFEQADWADLQTKIEGLAHLAERPDAGGDDVRRLFKALVPEYTPYEQGSAPRNPAATPAPGAEPQAVAG